MALDQSIVTRIRGLGDFAAANVVLDMVPGITPELRAEYLVTAGYTSNGGAPNPNNNQPKPSTGPSIGTLLGIPTAVAGIVGMIAPGAAMLAKIGTGMLAMILQIEVFVYGKKAGGDGTAANIGKAVGLSLAAVAATGFWLSKFNKGDTPGTKYFFSADSAGQNVIGKLMTLINHGYFTMNPHAGPAFLYTLAIAGAITAAVLAAGVLAGALGSSADDPTTADGASVTAMLKALPNWWQALPSASVGIMTAGLMAGTAGVQLSPTDLYKVFPVNAVQLRTGIRTSVGLPTGAATPQILIQQGATTDTVYVQSGSGANATVLAFRVDKQGYIIGANGQSADPTKYLPIAQKTANGFKWNQGALDAILRAPACAAIENDPTMDPQTREAALEQCMLSAKGMQFTQINQ